MSKHEDSLCERHREFVPLIAAVERAEGSLEGGAELLRAGAVELHETFAHGVIPHAVGEGRTVFPVLRRVTGTDRQATEMTHDHREIARLTDELERVTEELEHAQATTATERNLRRILQDLRTTLSEHFEAEEAVCFRILSSELDPEEARSLYEAMETAAADLRRVYE
ncbi:MAG TPA: hemerythrin domain-containing protein [Actinomycetota bacterium]|nr:hemerythrin domain-containing protein [Actinomycetota bacterium]